ncbi:MAG: hypothetical protein R2847_03695 [Bacteroidia bacterium]
MKITLKLFRDCADFVLFDNTILIGVFNKGTNALGGSYTVALKDSGGLTLNRFIMSYTTTGCMHG